MGFRRRRGYGGTRWGREPFFKKVSSPQNSFATPPAKVFEKKGIVCFAAVNLHIVISATFPFGDSLYTQLIQPGGKL